MSRDQDIIDAEWEESPLGGVQMRVETAKESDTGVEGVEPSGVDGISGDTPPDDGDDIPIGSRTPEEIGEYLAGDGDGDGDSDNGYGDEATDKTRRGTKFRSKPKPGARDNTPGHRKKVSAAGHNHGKQSAGNAIKPFPNPPHRHFRDDNRMPNGKPLRFFDYLKSLKDSPAFSDRVMVYIYSIWPVLKEKQRQLGKEVNYFTVDDILRQYGCGDYNLKLNDMGANYAAICQCTIKNVGDRALTEFPPIRTLEAVEVTDPANASYIQYCRSHGIKVPGDEGYQTKSDEEKDEMATVTTNEAVRDLTGLVRDLATENRRESRESRDRVRDPDPSAQAVTSAVDVVNDAAKAGQNLLSTAMDGILRMQQQQGDPTVVIGKVAELLKTMTPPPAVAAPPGQGLDDVIKLVTLVQSSSSGYQDKLFQIQNQRSEEQSQQIQHMRALIEAQATRPNPESSTPTPPRTLVDQLNEMKLAKDTLKEVLGLDEDSGRPGFDWAGNLPLIIQGVTLAGTLVASIVHNIAVVRSGQGTPAPLPPPEQILTPDQMDGAQAGAMGFAPGAVTQYHPQTGQPQSQPQGQTQPSPTNPQSQQDAMISQYHQFLTQIQTPLLRSFQAGDSGDEFAQKLIEITESGFFGPGVLGRQIYDGILENGEQIVGTLIRTHPGIWSVVSQTPQKWDKFLHDFFRADEIWDEEDAIAAREEAAREAQGRQSPEGSPTPQAIPSVIVGDSQGSDATNPKIRRKVG